MARKGKGSQKNHQLKRETVQSILAVVFFIVAIFLLMAYFHKAGEAGRITAKILSPVFGWGYFILPALLIVLGISLLTTAKRNFALLQIMGGVVFFLSGLSFLELIASGKGGFIGLIIAKPITSLFDQILSVILVLSFLIISSLITFDAALKPGFLINLWAKVRSLLTKKSPGTSAEKEIINVNNTIDSYEKKSLTEEEKGGKRILKESAEKATSKEERKKTEEPPINLSKISLGGRIYKPPPLELLSKDQGKPGVGDIKANANIIKRTLQNFGISVEMDEITIGPTVTRYALKPAEGVKISRIVGLQNDLALALAAHPLRIEAPIPGKSLVGVEIPNSVKTTVGLGSILSEEEFQKSSRPLLLALGKAISGKSHFADLSKMPHLLIAGATGSGKSVLIHAIITSLIYRNSPENLKFILIDPKRVELTLYNQIPHLLTPVLTDSKKTIMTLKWATKEMDRRYDILESEKVRDISSYHKNVVEPELKKTKGGKEPEGELPESMPYIVVVIDELADIMSTYPRELEAAIVRLAQMSRATGIHLILSTQRPSVNVITGLIKANISARIALQVASQIDSRTILDTGGAEKLLGGGDMLYLSGEMSKPQRFQAAFISEVEVKDTVKYLSDHYQTSENMVDLASANLIGQKDRETNEGDDDLYEEARDLVMKAGKASTSYLQRRLRVGYARAARLIDMLEEQGVVGPGEGAKPREVLEGIKEEEEETS